MNTSNSQTTSPIKNAADALSHGAHQATSHASQGLEEASESARVAAAKVGDDIASSLNAVKRDGAKWLGECSSLAREKLASVTESTTEAIRHDPVKAVLIAAAAGAALVALSGLLLRGRGA